MVVPAQRRTATSCCLKREVMATTATDPSSAMAPRIAAMKLLFKHDDCDFFCWSLEQLAAEKWQITELSFDLHESSLDDEYKIMTTYEQRWLNEGKAINFVKATR